LIIVGGEPAAIGLIGGEAPAVLAAQSTTSMPTAIRGRAVFDHLIPPLQADNRQKKQWM
jgi:hypothetical protein